MSSRTMRMPSVDRRATASSASSGGHPKGHGRGSVVGGAASVVGVMVIGGKPSDNHGKWLPCDPHRTTRASPVAPGPCPHDLSDGEEGVCYVAAKPRVARW